MSDKKRDVTEAWDEAKARPIRDSLNAVEVGTYIDGLHTTGDALRAALTTERSKHTETTREALEFSQAQGDTNRKLRAEVERWRDDALRLREGAARMDDEVCQTLGEALGFPWYKDDQENFPGAALRHGVCVGDHVAESLAVEAAHEIERLRAEVERLRRPEAEAWGSEYCCSGSDCGCQGKPINPPSWWTPDIARLRAENDRLRATEQSITLALQTSGLADESETTEETVLRLIAFEAEIDGLRAQLAEAWDGGAEAARRNAEIDPAVRDPERNPHRREGDSDVE